MEDGEVRDALGAQAIGGFEGEMGAEAGAGEGDRAGGPQPAEGRRGAGVARQILERAARQPEVGGGSGGEDRIDGEGDLARPAGAQTVMCGSEAMRRCR